MGLLGSWLDDATGSDKFSRMEDNFFESARNKYEELEKKSREEIESWDDEKLLAARRKCEYENRDDRMSEMINEEIYRRGL